MFSLDWKKSTLKELNKLDRSVAIRIYKKVEEMKDDLFSSDIKKISSEEKYRLRVGDYRIIFSIEKKLITIWKVGHRKNIYKRRN